MSNKALLLLELSTHNNSVEQQAVVIIGFITNFNHLDYRTRDTDYRQTCPFHHWMRDHTNTPDIIKRTRKMSKIDRNNAFRGLKFDTERA